MREHQGITEEYKINQESEFAILDEDELVKVGVGGGGEIERGELSKGREGGPPSTCLPCHYQLSHKPTCGERSKFDWVLFTPRKGI